MINRVTFGLLGPLQVRDGQRQVNVAGRRQRRVLAMLLLRSNRTVRLSELIAVGWDDDPPVTARRQVQNAVSQLRQVLTRHGAATMLLSDPTGYRMRVTSDQLDLLRFHESIATAGKHVVVGDAAKAAAALRAGVSLFYGAPLSGLGSAVLRRHASGIDEQRLAALEDCLEYETAREPRSELVAELTGLVNEYPLRERLASLLMVAHYRAGRRSDALAVYRRVAAALADELGVDPGVDLRNRHAEILRGVPVASGEAAPARPMVIRPAQLPSAPPMFVGRAAALRKLARSHAALADTRTGAAPIAVITGAAGVGKTSLALNFAHRIVHDFPDGQLYVNLCGAGSGPPLTPETVLQSFLQALNVPEHQVPHAPQDRAAMFRSVLATRRILLLLDNARDAHQVRPLLPGPSSCLVIVTSRSRLTSLAATNVTIPISLDLFTDEESRLFLTKRLGVQDVPGSQDAISDLVDACGRLPLALAIAAARAQARPGYPLPAVAQECFEPWERTRARASPGLRQPARPEST